MLVDLSAGISSGLGSGEDLVTVYGRISHSNVQEESLDTNYWLGESGLALITISSQHVNSLLQIKLGKRKKKKVRRNTAQ